MPSQKDSDLQIGAVKGAVAPEGVDAVEGSEAAGAAEGAQSAGSIEALTQALAAGDIDAVEAQRRLIEAVVAEQLPEGSTPEIEAALRAEVENLLADDPTLQALLRPGA